jgi:hypothetical protein
MGAGKCIECKSCLDMVYTKDMRLFFHCWLCNKWYRKTPKGALVITDSPLTEQEEQELLDAGG